MQIDTKFVDYVKKEMKSKNVDPTSLGVIYKYLGDEGKALEAFKSLTTYEMPSSVNIIGLTEEAKNDTNFLIGIGKDELRMAIENDLALRNRDRSRQFLIWAAEYCFIPESTLKEWTSIKQFDLIAVGYLWRGYALLMLGKYEEACGLLRQVPVWFNKEKMTGGDVWQIYEPKLVKALLPLCEYKLNPTKDNRMRARLGLEEYIGLFKEPKFKLEGYLYYYHLREMFPEIYSEMSSEINPIKKTVRPVVEPTEKMVELNHADIKGTVFISDSDRNNLWPFGTIDELLQYVEKVKNIGGYPLLSSLMDVYGVEETAGLGPEPLIEECEKLSSSSEDHFLREHTKSILKVAKKAFGEDLGVILYLEPDVE